MKWLGMIMFGAAVIVFGCSTPNDAARIPAIEQDRLIGEWQEVESLANANFLHPATADVDASVTCNRDGTFIIQEGGTNATFFWRRQEDGRAVVVPTADDTDNRHLFLLYTVNEDELVVGNQMGGARFRRIKSGH